MTVAFQWSTNELARVYGLAYQGRTARLCLAVATSGLTVNSTTAEWDAAEISNQAANGYARAIWTLPAGSYDAALTRFQTTTSSATFQATSQGLGFNFNSVYLVLGTQNGNNVTWDSKIAGLFTESPSLALAPGEPRTYKVFFVTDDITTL